MSSMLFESFKLNDLYLKNRVMMSPMCMYSAKGDGHVTDFHVLHYSSRAIGQVGLIMMEVSAVDENGLGNPTELGIWNDSHIDGLKKVVENTQEYGAKIGLQIGHAGRKSELQSQPIAPSALPFDEDSPVPREMTKDDINFIKKKFKDAASRADQAGFDVLEIHAAHGYLINQFLSPLTNQRTDSYGGTKEKRYLFLKEILEEVFEVWKKPLFVRISANEFHKDGSTLEDMVFYSKKMKEQGVTLITSSAGGVVPTKVEVFPGYEVPYSDYIRKEVGLPMGAVGLITEPLHAEEILRNRRGDLILLGRELLRDPYWVYRAAQKLGDEVEAPSQYKRGWDFEIGRALKNNGHK